MPLCSSSPSPPMETRTRGVPACADGEWRLSRVPPHRKMFTMKESLAPCRRVLLHHRRHRTDRDLFEIDAGNRLLDLQRSRLACLGVDAIPVVQAKRDVAILLHLEHHHVAQRVNGSGSDEDGIAESRGEARQKVRHGMAREGPLEIISSGASLQAREDAAGRPCLQHDPRFGLAALAGGDTFRLSILGMHLDRELLVCVEKLEEHRKSLETARQFSQQLVRRLLQQLPDGRSFERSVGDLAGMVIAVTQEPGFTNRSVAGQRCREHIRPGAGRPRADTGRSVRIATDTWAVLSWFVFA